MLRDEKDNWWTRFLKNATAVIALGTSFFLMAKAAGDATTVWWALIGKPASSR